MDSAVADLLEEEEKKANERKRLATTRSRQTEEEFIKFPANGGVTDDFERKYRLDSPARLPSRGKDDLFDGHARAGRLKYEDEHTSSPKTPGEKKYREERVASDTASANGSVRSSRRNRTRSPDHDRRRRDNYRTRDDDRHHSSRYSRDRDDDRHHRSRRDGNDSSDKRQEVDSNEVTGTSHRPRRDDERDERPASEHGSDRYHRRDDNYRSRRDDHRRDDRYDRQERREPYRKKTPEPTDDERDLRTVFCQQLAARLRTKELKEFFSTRAGAVQDAQIVKDRVSGRSKGVGYVEFKDKESIERALSLTGHKLLGIPIIVTISDAEKNRQAKVNSEGAASANNNGQPYHRLYVGNIQFSITEDDITSLFESFGPLDFVQLQRDELGRSKGYGFVQFTDPKDAQAALESMNGQMLNNRPMRVGLGTTDKLAQEANASLQQRQAAQTGSAFSGAGGRGGYASNQAEKDANKGAGASALDDNDVNGVSLNNVNRHELMRKLARIDDGDVVPTERKKPAVVEKTEATRCVCLANMFTAKTMLTQGWQKEIEEDVRQECNKNFGIVKHVGVDPNSQQGEVYVKFDRVLGGENAYKGLNGRFFDEQRIHAKYIVDAAYNALFPKASNL